VLAFIEMHGASFEEALEELADLPVDDRSDSLFRDGFMGVDQLRCPKLRRYET
jgi:hypothetical protein